MPQTTVAALIHRTRNGQAELLLTRRNVHPFIGLWCIPGGHVEKFETLEEAVSREAEEETGLRFQGVFFRWFEEIFPSKSIHNVVMVFEGEVEGEPVPQESEVREIKWFGLKEARSLKLAFGHNEVLDAWGDGLS